MRKLFAFILCFIVLLTVTGVLVFHFTLELSWVDSIYFVITIMTTVGFGDINLRNAPAVVKVFGNLLMIGGAASMAALFGILTDYLLGKHLERYLGVRRTRMQKHIVLCGLGRVGIRTLEYLHKVGEKVLVIEDSESSEFIDQARSMKVEVITGDMRVPSILDRANIKEAKALIAVSDDDLSNLEVALNARQVRPDIRLVLRMFDQNLASKLEGGFGIKTAFSTASLAAPSFAMAALDPAVVGSLLVRHDVMLSIELVIAQGSQLDGITTKDLETKGDLSVLFHESANTGVCSRHPSDSIPLVAGDTIIVSTSPDVFRELEALNVV